MSAFNLTIGQTTLIHQLNLKKNNTHNKNDIYLDNQSKIYKYIILVDQKTEFLRD